MIPGKGKGKVSEVDGEANKEDFVAVFVEHYAYTLVSWCTLCVILTCEVVVCIVIQ